MSLFGTIMSKIFGHAEAAPAGGSPTPSPAPTSSAPTSSASTSSASTSPASTTTASASPAPESAKAAGGAPVDVAAVLTALAAKKSEKLDWRKSIVDLMKLLDLDSSLSARKELAGELHYTGDTNDSATMNIWLHKQVMQKLAENGGKVPDELKH